MIGAPSTWVRRLGHYAALSRAEQDALNDISAPGRQHAAHDDLVKAGAPADRIFVVIEGCACRYKLLPDGRRQILSYLFPGDMEDPRQMLLSRIETSMCCLWPSVVATLAADAVRQLLDLSNVSSAIARYSFAQQAIAREWLVNLGHRTAFERLAHLLCEIHERLHAVGLAVGHAFRLPLTQAELGDTLALSAVHINRTLMEMRRLRLVTFQNHHVQIHDFAGLQIAAGFDPAYLHLGESAFSQTPVPD